MNVSGNNKTDLLDFFTSKFLDKATKLFLANFGNFLRLSIPKNKSINIFVIKEFDNLFEIIEVTDPILLNVLILPIIR